MRHFFYNIQLQKMSWPWNLYHRSLMVIESGTVWYIGYGFLLLFYSTSLHRYGKHV